MQWEGILSKILKQILIYHTLWSQSFCHYWFIWSTTAQYPMVKQWSQSSYIIMWECVIWLMAYATENVVALASKTDCGQEMKIKSSKIQSTYSMTHENSRSNTKGEGQTFYHQWERLFVALRFLTIAFFCRNWKEEFLELHIVQPKCYVN